jgi:hypothetical protein
MANPFEMGPDCVSAEAIDAASRLPADSAERRAIEEHVSSCPRCRTEAELLHSFESGVIREDEQEAVASIAGRLSAPPRNARVTEMKPKGWPANRRWLVAALAVAAGIVLAINVDWRRRGNEPGTGPDVYRSATLQAVAPAGTLAAMPQEFRWSETPGAARYKLTVEEVDRTVVFETITNRTSEPVPAPVRNLMKPGKTLQWRVTAEDSHGATIAESGVQRFQFK